VEGHIVKAEDNYESKSYIILESYIKCVDNKDNICGLNPIELEALELIRKEKEIGIKQFKVKYESSTNIIRKFKKNSLIEIIKKEVFRRPSWEGIENWMDGSPFTLTDGQKEAIETIRRSIRAEKRQAFLLHGVTGSGKTEVYWRAIEEVIGQGKQALLLVPEIALTSQLMGYLRSRCQDSMAILHSGLSPGERLDEWRRIKKGHVKLVIGARSAIFAPLNRLGIIIVDEEHDPSYKQEEKVRYHARDLALVRGKMENAGVLLGSATPSLESYFNALQGKFSLLTLPARIDGRPLPEIQVTDMRKEKSAGKERLILSQALEEALLQNAQRGEQTLLFLNRRGFSTFALCRDCGFVYRCPNCSVSLIYHLTQKSYRCHYCDYSLPAQACCSQCSSPGVMLFGTGTQRLEEEIKKRLPQVQMARMDRDTMTRKLSHRRLLNSIRRGEVNLLIGTQMIAKGHDLPGVTLVGVLAADLSLNIPDFRASERTFQLLTQVAGRSGRGTLPGKVIIQTYNPDHYSVQLAKRHDFEAFYQQETQFRREMNYPPFGRLINLRWEGNTEDRVFNHAQAVARCAQEILTHRKKWQGQVEILGPTMAPLARLRGKSRCQLLLKGKHWALLHEFAGQILEKAEEISIAGVKMVIDVDPVNML
jgi:primosomal protein N' (replication factor Y) (superfamily II helicase)